MCDVCGVCMCMRYIACVVSVRCTMSVCVYGVGVLVVYVVRPVGPPQGSRRRVSSGVGVSQ